MAAFRSSRLRDLARDLGWSLELVVGGTEVAGEEIRVVIPPEAFLGVGSRSIELNGSFARFGVGVLTRLRCHVGSETLVISMSESITFRSSKTASVSTPAMEMCCSTLECELSAFFKARAL